MTTQYDSTQDTLNHIAKVEGYLSLCADLLRIRGTKHDQSKLESPEKEIFDAVTPLLKTLTYGSYEYQRALGDMHEALAHHYAHNSHHPEHYPGGVADMTLLDAIEMLCDWKAASQRGVDGDFYKSLEINRARFGLSDQLYTILFHTAQALGW